MIGLCNIAPVSSKQLIPGGRFVPNINVLHTEFLVERSLVSNKDMSPRSTMPALGSLAIQSPSQSSQVVHVSPATCHNLSLFKGSSSSGLSDPSLQFRWCFSRRKLPVELLKEYRKLDDSVTMRINRTTAQFRDRDRMGASGKGSVQEQACSYIWQELVGTYGLLYHYSGVPNS